MTRLINAPRVALAAGILAALLAAGCSKQPNVVDPNFLTPEGTPSLRSVLVVSRDLPVYYDIYYDLTNDGYTPDDIRDPGGPFPLYASGPGAVTTTLIDSTLADTYQLLRREANGGFRVAQDFATFPSRRWIDTGWEAYRLIDPSPSGFQPPTYQCRGLYNSQVTTASPLSNLGLASVSSIANIPFDYQNLYNTSDLQKGIVTFNPPDSINFSLKWTPVASAAGYWISIYSFNGDANERLRVELPAPVYLGRTRDFLLAYEPAPASSYRMSGQPGATVLRQKPLINKQYYEVKITAVGSGGEIQAMCYGDNMLVVPGPPGSYQGVLHNTWNLIPANAIQLRPGAQTTQVPERAAGPQWAVAPGGGRPPRQSQINR
jgi:hypothetical protein